MRPEDTRQGKSRNVSARLPSGPSPLMLGGRTISGVMQYAMRPSGIYEARSVDSPPVLPPSRPTPDATLGEQDENAPGETMPETPGPGYHDEEDGEGYQVEGYNMAEIRDSVVGLTDQESDEIWMSYVRQQLGTLFPDFFHRDPLHADYDEMNDSSNPLPSPYIPTVVDQERGWGLVRDGAHHRPIEESTHMALQARNGMIGVPNVRQEINGLKEEIERLRGVVGGLASGMYERGVVRPVEQVDASAHGPTAREGNGALADRLENGFAHDVHRARESETKAVQGTTIVDQHRPGLARKDIPFEVTQQDVHDPAGSDLPAIDIPPDGQLSPGCLTAGYTEQEDEDVEAVEAEVRLEDTLPTDLPEAFFQVSRTATELGSIAETRLHIYRLTSSKHWPKLYTRDGTRRRRLLHRYRRTKSSEKTRYYVSNKICSLSLILETCR